MVAIGRRAARSWLQRSTPLQELDKRVVVRAGSSFGAMISREFEVRSIDLLYYSQQVGGVVSLKIPENESTLWPRYLPSHQWRRVARSRKACLPPEAENQLVVISKADHSKSLWRSQA